TGIGMANEEKVLLPQGAWANGILCEIVVDLQTAVLQIGLQSSPLVDHVTHCFVQGAFWQQSIPPGFEPFFNPAPNRGCQLLPQVPALFTSQSFLPVVLLDQIKLADLFNKPTRFTRVLHLRFDKFAPRMSQTGATDQPWILRGQTSIH